MCVSVHVPPLKLNLEGFKIQVLHTCKCGFVYKIVCVKFLLRLSFCFKVIYWSCMVDRYHWTDRTCRSDFVCVAQLIGQSMIKRSGAQSPFRPLHQTANDCEYKSKKEWSQCTCPQIPQTAKNMFPRFLHCSSDYKLGLGSIMFLLAYVSFA